MSRFCVLSFACSLFSLPVSLVGASELTDLLELSYQNNSDLKAVEALVDRERALLLVGMTPDDPKVGFSSLERRGITRYGVLTQNIRFPLKYYWQYKIQKKRIKGRQSGYRMKKFAVRGKVISLYYSIYSMQNILRITRANIRTVKEFARIAEKKYASGQSSQGDSMKAHVELTRLELDLIGLVREEEALQDRLKSVVNSPRFTGLNFSGRTLPFPRYRGSPEVAVENSPLLKKEFFMFQAAEIAGTASQWEFLPDVQLQYQWRLSGEPAASRIYSFKITLPLWFWKKGLQASATMAYKRAREHRFKHEEQKMTALIRELEGRVRSDAQSLKIYTTGLIPQAQGAYNLSKSAYRANKTSFLNLLDSERSLYGVQTGFYRTLVSYVKNIARLESELGAKIYDLEKK